MGKTTELDRDTEATEDEVAIDDQGTARSAAAAHDELPEAGGSRGLNKGEGRVLERLRRAKEIATMAAPDVQPTIEDLVEIAEMIEDEGG